MAVVLATLVWASPLAAQQPAAASKLSPQESHGEMLFFQRCSICHLPPLVGPADTARLPFGPLLYGFMDNARNADRARQVIMIGGAQMPGFQYGLTASEVDDILAYMKSAPMKTPPEWFLQAQKRPPRGRGGERPVD
jgi:mono/diheme cytochrome c family protein